jgi:hypothetical protein
VETFGPNLDENSVYFWNKTLNGWFNNVISARFLVPMAQADAANAEIEFRLKRDFVEIRGKVA